MSAIAGWRDPVDNLITACPDDFANACRSIAEHPEPFVGIVTGFFIPNATPPAAETDGPLGALFLYRAWRLLRIPTLPWADPWCIKALKAGYDAWGPPYRNATDADPSLFDVVTHLVAIERVGPNHTWDSYQEQLCSISKRAARSHHRCFG